MILRSDEATFSAYHTHRLGMAAVARQLKPAIEKAIKEKAIELEKNKQLVHSHSEEMSR